MKKKILWVLYIILFANLLVASIKIYLGIRLKINSLMADGFHAITDSSANIIAIIGIHLAYKPADNDHPYGYYKFETIASMIIGLILFYITGKITYNAISWFIKPIIPEYSFPGIITLFTALGINIFISIYEYHQGKKLHSEVLIADSIHTKTDVFISIGVISTIIGIKLGLPAIIDPIVSLVIAVFVFLSSYEILKKTIRILVDKKAIDENKIMNIVYQIDKDIINIHKIKSRGSNNYLFIEMHMIVDPHKTVKEAHELSHMIEAVLAQKLGCDVELNVHLEPDEKNVNCWDIVT